MGKANVEDYPPFSTSLLGLCGISIMTGRDFVACAEEFAKGRSEAELRSAVSRAYYRVPRGIVAAACLRRLAAEDRAGPY